MHSVILLWFSLDVIKLWMTTKDGLYLVDSHQLPLRPCVVCHYCFNTFFFLVVTNGVILRFIHHVVLFFEGSVMWLNQGGHVVLVTKCVAYK